MPEQQHYKEFQKGVGTLENLEEELRLHNTEEVPEVRDKAINDLKERVYKEMDSGLRPASAGELTLEEAVRHGQSLHANVTTNTVNIFYDNIDTIVDKEMSNKTLETLLGNGYVQGFARKNEKHEALLDSYQMYAQYQEFRERYKEGTRLNEKEQEIVEQAALQGIAKKEEERIAGKYPKVLAEKRSEQAMVAAQLAMKYGRVSSEKRKEYVLPGMDETLKELKKKYEAEAQKQKIDIYNIARASVKELARTVKGEERTKVYRNLIYAAEKGKPMLDGREK